MIGLIRGLLDRPLDPRHARAILALASCLTVAFAVLVGLGMIGGPRPEASAVGQAATVDHGPPTAPSPAPAETRSRVPEAKHQPRTPQQDPQDRRGGAAYRRARRTLHQHRALQRLPYRRRGLAITLVAADHGRAVVRIVAATPALARRDWRHFLRRSRDGGRSYVPRFRGRSGRHGS